MRRERLARWLLAGEGANRCSRSPLPPSRRLVFGRRRFKLLELKLHLVEQARLAFAARLGCEISSKRKALRAIGRKPDEDIELGSSGLLKTNRPEKGLLLA
jgi:hypothetical protein